MISLLQRVMGWLRQAQPPIDNDEFLSDKLSHLQRVMGWLRHDQTPIDNDEFLSDKLSHLQIMMGLALTCSATYR